METTSTTPVTKKEDGSSRPNDAAGEEVLVLLRRIIHAVDLHSKKLSRETGLTTPQVVVLQAIRDSGEVTTGRISSAVSLSQATVTTILDRLEARGLIDRYRSDIDRRVVHSRLTAEGRAALRKAPQLLHESFRKSFSSMSHKNQTAILDALRDVAEMMGAETLDVAPILDVGPPVSIRPGRSRRSAD